MGKGASQTLPYRDAVFLAHAGLDFGVNPQLVLALPLGVEQHRLKLHPHFVRRGPRPVRLLRHDGDELFDAASETGSCFGNVRCPLYCRIIKIMVTYITY